MAKKIDWNLKGDNMRYLRRVFCCWLLDIHWRAKWSNPERGIASGGKCGDCGKIFEEIVFPRC